jgi:hypothetical protein
MAVIPAPGPLRTYAVVTLVDTIGFGLYATGSVLFFTQILHFTAAFVGVTLTIAAVAGLAAAVPGGRLSDRVGRKQTLVPLYLLQAALFAVLPFARTPALFVIVVCGIAFAEGAARPARRAALSSLVTGEARVAASAYNRAVLNVGFSIGTLGAGAALAVGSVPAYTALIWGNALSFVGAAVLFARLPLPPLQRRLDRDRAGLLFTPRMVASALCCGILFASASLLDVGLPLQVSEKTDAPHWIIAGLLLVNTAIAIALQVRASRGSETVSGAARANRRAGIWLVGACALFAASAIPNSGLAIAALVGAVIALTAGELLSSAGQWGMSYALAPQHREAEFLAGFGLVSGAAGVAGPFLATQVVTHGSAGWIAAAAVFLIAGLAAPRIARSRVEPSLT